MPAAVRSFRGLPHRCEKVARIDWKTGKRSKSDQWIVRLSANLDMMQVLGGLSESAALPAPEAEQPASPLESAAPPSDPAQKALSAPEAAVGPDDDHEQIADLRKQLSELMRELHWTPQKLTALIEERGVQNPNDPEFLAALVEEMQQSRNQQDLPIEAADDVPF